MRYAGVPLKDWPEADQKQAHDKIVAVCGENPPICPRGAVLERATLDYIELRAMVRAANHGSVK